MLAENQGKFETLAYVYCIPPYKDTSELKIQNSMYTFKRSAGINHAKKAANIEDAD